MQIEHLFYHCGTRCQNIELELPPASYTMYQAISEVYLARHCSRYAKGCGFESHPSNISDIMFSQDSGKYRVYSANTHRCMGKNQNNNQFSIIIDHAGLKFLKHKKRQSCLSRGSRLMTRQVRQSCAVFFNWIIIPRCVISFKVNNNSQNWPN